MMGAGEEDRVQLAKRWEEMIYSKIQQRERGKKKKESGNNNKINKNVGQLGFSFEVYLSFTDINRQNVVDQQI